MGLVHHPNVVTDGLISCWDAGNRRSYPGTGLDWIDLAGGANGFITNNGVNTIDFVDEKGGYLDFDGSDDYVACSQPNYDTTGDWSWCMWLNRITSGAPTYPLIYGGVDNTRIFWYNSGSDVILGIYSEETSGPQPAVNDRFPADEWCMLALKKEGNSLYFCFDADYWTEYTRSSSNWGSDEFIWTNIGEGLGYFWHGYTASVHMYNRAISFDEVKQNYESLKPRFEPRITKSGLVGNWDAGDPESYVGGLLCKDTANGTAATLEGGIIFNSANGGYWEFDGTDDYIQCSDDSVLQPQSFSVEAWVYDHQPATDVVDHNLPIVAWRDSTDPAVWTSYHSSNKKPYIYMGSSGTDGRYFDATAASVVGWHHVVFTYTYDDITTGAFYVDGVSQSVSTTYDDDKDPTDRCRIGRAGLRYYQGSMGLVRIYDTPLSAAEVMDNFQKTRGRFGV